MGRSKRKRGDSTGASLTSLGPKSQQSPVTPKELAKVSPAVEPVRKSAPSPSQRHLPTISRGPEALRQAVATSQAQQRSGNQAGYMRVEYLAKVAKWAATAVPPLGAFLGHRLGTASVSAAIPPPTPHPICQRCETILQVGQNCTVRVTKAPKKWRKAGPVNGGIQTTVVYSCHFCKFANKKPGTAREHVKTKRSQLAALSQMKSLGQSKTPETTPVLGQTKGVGKSKTAAAASPTLSGIPLTPPAQVKGGGSSKNSNLSRAGSFASPVGASSTPSSNSMEQGTTGGKKRKRKGWSSLKEMSSANLRTELPTPARLGFMSPLNPNRKG